ncbi:Cytoplasmic dynein 1 intermediate chain 2 [Cyphellophora attinorum]|uniref:Cytoplasmic dynein 1 intermediate chain 2 n=1 Tax=Cyphellophora attinorum TaxID=1664694 RepID=A0A0N1P1G4_9EURO|nr:Cytoplasmic dynein 1 intermediate chain 2 [Phialophora attinorum]KPI45140.1 Cytoplasmic dynein 1 intermediate chain 2 [Phialophora attinorum]
MPSVAEELLAKKARLAELRQQRALKQEQVASRRSIGGADAPSPRRTAQERRADIDNIVDDVLNRKRDSIGVVGANRRESVRPSALSDQSHEAAAPSPRPAMVSMSTQTTEAVLNVGSESVPPWSTTVVPSKEYITYTKAVQTDPWSDESPTEGSDEDDIRKRSRRRSSKKTAEEEEAIRAQLRREIEDELQATQNGHIGNQVNGDSQKQRFPLRTLTDNEMNAVTASTDFISFVERSSKVIERALDEEYDLLADYTRAAALQDDEDDTTYSRSTRKSHSLKESLQLFSDRHSRRRMISDIQSSPHFPELVLTAYTKNPSAPNESPGQVLLWNTHAPSRPEYVFASGSDVLSARFSPFHPNYVIDLPMGHASNNPQPVQRTPQSGSHLGHTHPVYNISIIGTPNAHNIITASMDGVVCSWSFDMLTQAQEYHVLHTPPPAKTEDLAPTSLSFPAADPTFFLVGTEEGSIYPCHRYDRAGAKAGVDTRLAYRGHTAPVMSTHFHPARGPVDLGDLLLSSSSDWSLKLWRVKPAAATSSSAAAAAAATNNTSATLAATPLSLTGTNTPSNQPTPLPPLLDIPREDLIYDAKWHPHRPSIFATCTGAGELEVFDLLYDADVPITKIAPSRGKNGVMPFRGLNKVAWEERRGGYLAAGGLDGVVSVFEVGKGLQGGTGEGNTEEWMGMRRLVSRLEGRGGVP